ncbi:MAG: ABC transporter ATP-binding protein/permease, partial [Gorillibacterium sp.]|nr:ABC transporter ATP-binding protein/permease [Gorillibacterium sp.]
VELTLYMKMIVNPLQQLGNVFNIIQRSRASLDRMDQLLSIQSDIQDEEQATDLPPDALDIEIRDLSFTYPEANRMALQQISLRLAPGQTLGIVGKTGSGKSTLAKLLLRVYNPPRNTIFIGGKDIIDLKLGSLRTQLSYVPQDGFLFSTTIGDNIAFSNRKAQLNQVEQAARQAEVYDHIALFPKGFGTKLGERGLTLSGGQRQRTSIARGFMKDAPILILDDSVSAVDSITESRILSNLRRIRAGQTTVIIAHRISAVKHADLILVLDNGVIVERGTHQELLTQGGEYATLCMIQEGGEADDQTAE